MLTDRNRRRLAKRTMMLQAAAIRNGHVPVLPDRPEVNEVFRLDDDGTGNPIFFDVRALRSWAKANLKTVSVALEPARAQRFLETGQVELDHVMAHTVHHNPEPMIVCRGAGGPGEDAIVDGSHRYVAATMGAAMISMKTAGYHAYVFEPDQWRAFVITPDELIARSVA